MERRDFNFKIKSLDDRGTFVGLGVVYGTLTSGTTSSTPEPSAER